MTIINYESDFKIVEGFKDGSSILAAPFKFTYYTRMSRGTYVASYDGTEFVNCHPTDDGRVVVPFDNPQFGMGALNVKREFFLNDKDFADGICNLVSVESTGIVLDRGATDMDGEVNIELFPFYQRGLDGKDGVDGKDGADGAKGEKGDPLTYDDLTEEQKKDLVSQIPLPYSEFINGGVVNISKTGDIERVYDSLPNGGVALCIIGDSEGNYPSSDSRVNANGKYNDAANYFFSTEPRGANVGDLLMITKQRYLLIYTVCALRIIPLNDAKIPIEGFSGTDGIMTVWDKQRINKVDGIEWTANDTRSWLNGVVNSDLYKTKYGYGNIADTCLKTGVNNYVYDTIGGLQANWSLFVTCSTDGDGGGYYHLIQTAICRDDNNLGRIFLRFGYYRGDGENLYFTTWREVGYEGLATRGYVDETIQSAITNTLNTEV